MSSEESTHASGEDLNSSVDEEDVVNHQEQHADQPTRQNDLVYQQNVREHLDYVLSMRKEIRLLVLRNPQLKPFEESELDKKLKAQSKEELETILENIKTDLGLVKPCVAGNTLTMMIGQVFERIFGMHGFSQQLLKNSEFIVSMDSFVPNSFLKHGPKVKAVESFLSEYLEYQKNN